MSPRDVRRTGTLKLPPGTGYGNRGAETYGMEVIGNDFSPKICAGDAPIVDPAKVPKPGGFVETWPTGAPGTPTLRYLAGPGEGDSRYRIAF